MDIREKVVIVTGASRGIGVHLAEAFAAKGARLALAARSAEELEATARRVGGVAVPTDVADEGDLARLLETTERELGPVDILVNNAGIESYAPYESYDVDLMEKILRVNVLAPMKLTRMALGGMLERGRGHIVNIASVAGKTAVPFNVVYSTSKHALVGFSWSLREEVRPRGVSVSVVCPGFVADSGMFANWSGGRRPPGLAATVSPQKVAQRTIAAVERDLAEVIVAGGLARVVDVFHALSPKLTTGLARRSGAYRFLESATRSTHRT